MILVECKPDKILVMVIAGIGKRSIRHAGNKFELMKQLEKLSMALGIIDEDPGKNQPIQLNRAKDISMENIKKAGLQLLMYKSNLVLVLKPRLEEWLLETIKELGMNPKDVGLSRDPEQLHATINYNLSKLKELLLKIREKRSERLATIRNIIRNYKKILKNQR